MSTHILQDAFQDERAVIAFGARLRGDLIRPGDGAYEVARALWNGMIDKHPALIARCADTADVVEALRFARELGLPLTVRGGGHNVAGSASIDGGLVLDLSRMNRVAVDLAARRVTAGGGATIGDVDRATQPYGLAVPLGVVSETGIAGLTLGGGFGWQARMRGLSCDALRSAEVVTADGRVLVASETEHPDLFWALRGGGGNFGVVTRFEFEAYPLGPDVFSLAVFYPVDAARAVLATMRDRLPDFPDAFSSLGVLGHIPEAPVFPEEVHGAPMVALVGVWTGPVEEGAEALAPLRRLAEPLADFSGPVPFLDMQRFFDEDYPSGGRYYWKSVRLSGLPDEAIDALVALNDEAPSAHSTLDVWFTSGGAYGRVPAEATAFGDRSAPFMIGVEANWHEAAEDDANVAWGRRCIEAMRPYAEGGFYLNFPGFVEEGEALVRAALGPNYERLQHVKRRYDPDDVFRTHQRILPA